VKESSHNIGFDCSASRLIGFLVGAVEAVHGQISAESFPKFGSFLLSFATLLKYAGCFHALLIDRLGRQKNLAWV
jgi:hypothetical protein